MEKKLNPLPESSQLVEPPLNQRKSEEAGQENLPVQEEKEDHQVQLHSHHLELGGLFHCRVDSQHFEFLSRHQQAHCLVLRRSVVQCAAHLLLVVHPHHLEAGQENLPVQEEKEDDQASFTSLGIWQINSLPDGSVSAFRVSEQSSTTPLFGASSFGSSQLVEPPVKQCKSEEAGQENLPVQEEKKDHQASFKSFGIWETISLPGIFTSFRVSEPSSTSPLFGASSFDSSMCRSTSSGGSSGFGQKPTGVWKHLDAVTKRKYLEAAQTEEKTRLYPGSGPFLLMSHPAITEEDGQTAKLESILSAMPAYNYERYESCFAIAGADYCVVAADSTRGHTRISKLSEKSVMASCGFQADVKALQEALAAENSTYEREHKKPMSCPEMHRLFRNIHKLHPNYIFIVLGGLDSEGKGCAYQLFGPGVATIASGVGHPGSRQIEPPRIPPILKYKLPAKDVLARMSETEAVRLAETVFRSVTKTGDKLEIAILNASGLRHVSVDLRKDCP